MTGTTGGPDAALRPVTVGVDSSRESRAAADWAAREAAYRGLPLLLVHAWIDEPLHPPASPEREAAQRLLDEARAELAGRYPSLMIATELLPEVAATGLTEKSRDAEFTVLGSRGHGMIMGFLLGSVGLPVAAHAEGPVVLVRPSGSNHERPERAWAEEGDEVVVGLSTLGGGADPVLSFAFAAAEARGAAVRAVRAWGTPSLFAADLPRELEQPTHESIEGEEGKALAATLDPWRQRFPRIPVIEHLRYGNAAEVLLSAAAFRAALLVVGRHRRHHRSPLLTLRLGPVAHAALHHARPPVAIVPYD